MFDSATRLLRVLALLQTQRRWTGPELAHRLGVSVRTIRSDVERLRALEYEIEAVPGVTGGYQLGSGTTLPPLRLDDDEAVAVAVGLQMPTGMADIDGHSAQAAAKLQQLLPARLRHRLHMINGAIEPVPTTHKTVAQEVFTAVATAIERNELLRFDYSDRHQEPSTRMAEPHRLVHLSGRWYLVGYDLDRHDWRTYRVDRLTPKTPTGPRFVPRELPGPDLTTFVTRGRMAALWNYTARVLIEAPIEVVAERIPTSIWVVEPIDSRTCVIEAGAQSAELLAAYLGTLDLDFRVDEERSPKLAAATAALAERYAAALRQQGH